MSYYEYLKYGINAIIFLLLLYIAYFIVNINHEKYLSDFKNTILLESKKNVEYSKFLKLNNGIKIEMTLLEKIHLKYIDQSNLKAYIPFASVYLLILIQVIIFVVLWLPLFKVFRNVITTCAFAGIFSIIPFTMLDALRRYNSELSRRNLSKYITSMSTWAQSKTDLMFLFEKASKDSTGPLSKFTKEMIFQLRAGIEPEVAMEILRLKVNNQDFNRFIIHISHAFINQGRIDVLLKKLEKEAYIVEAKMNQRKYKTTFERFFLAVLLLLVLLLTIYIFKYNIEVREIFVYTWGGQIILTLLSIVFMFAVFMQFKVSNIGSQNL